MKVDIILLDRLSAVIDSFIGLSTREIAGLLYLSIKTVETHRSHLKEKLPVRNTAELIQYAFRKGLIMKSDS